MAHFARFNNTHTHLKTIAPNDRRRNNFTKPNDDSHHDANKHDIPTISLWIGNSSSTDTWSRSGRGSTSTNSGELLISHQYRFQELVFFGIGEEITRKQFACLLGGRFVPVESSEK